ncbi:hypothetical protein BHE74_00002292 [Ensete ventricosum]|nr:hypothetical protein BHE74_00002292 [Ensete ventricosum]
MLLWCFRCNLAMTIPTTSFRPSSTITSITMPKLSNVLDSVVTKSDFLLWDLRMQQRCRILHC